MLTELEKKLVEALGELEEYARGFGVSGVCLEDQIEGSRLILKARDVLTKAKQADTPLYQGLNDLQSILDETNTQNDVSELQKNAEFEQRERQKFDPWFLSSGMFKFASRRDAWIVWRARARIAEGEPKTSMLAAISDPIGEAVRRCEELVRYEQGNEDVAHAIRTEFPQYFEEGK